MRTATKVVAPALTLALAMAAAKANAFDLTGTWEGKLKCRGINQAEGAKVKYSFDATVDISGSGGHVDVRSGSFRYRG